jgi:hypothetical protein
MVRRIGVCLSLLFCLAGCRTQPYVNAHIESVNTEYRELEDYVYCLEDENDRLRAEIDEQQKRAPGAGSRSAPGSGGFRRRPAADGRGPASPADSPPTIELPADTPPSIILPSVNSAATSGGAARTSATLPDDDSSNSGVEPRKLAKPAASPVDTKVTRLFLNPLLTTGIDLDGRPGEDGLRIVLEPRNISDEYVPAAGSLSIVVLDPTVEGESARLARWDFEAPAIKLLCDAVTDQPGIKLELPWPAAPPTSARLKLFVRFETADGQRLQTEREIFVTPPGQSASRWTPRAQP